MKKSIWNMKRNSLIRQATKELEKDFRPLIKSATSRPSDIHSIRDFTSKLLSKGGNVMPLADSIEILCNSESTIPDARNLLLGICRGAKKAKNNEQALNLGKMYYESLDLSSDSRLITALLTCAIEMNDENFALTIAEFGITDQRCRFEIINMIRRIIQKEREKLDREETSALVGKLLLQLRDEFSFSTQECKIIFRHYKKSHTKVAIHFGLLVNDYLDPKFNRVLCRILSENDLRSEAYDISKQVSEETEDSWHTTQVALIDAVESTSPEITQLIANLPTSAIQSDDLATISDYIASKSSENWVLFNIFNLLFNSNYGCRGAGNLALGCGRQLIQAGFNQADLMIKMASLMMYDGQFTKAMELLDKSEDHPSVTKKKSSIQARLDEFNKSLEINPVFPENLSLDKSNLIPDRVLYMLHNSLPYESGGYATRSHGLLCGVRQNGWDIEAVTRLAYPLDLTKHKGKSIPNKSEVDGVTYNRLEPNEIGYGDIPLMKYIQAYAEKLYDSAIKLKPSILHGASNHMNGHAANLVAKQLGIPSVYEVRGLWEITRASRQPNWHGSEQYLFVEKMEANAAKDATAVICITQALADEMVRRGVDRDKITLVHNGVHVDRFMPREPDSTLAKELGIDNQIVIGYVGSIVGYEGLNMLVEAAEKLQQRDILNFTILIIGDGAALESLEDQVSASPASRHFIFTGRVPHEDVERYYSLIDIAPFPRLSQPVTEMVSPLKPFEAMAMEKLVIASNVAALEEIVNDGVTGLLFDKDDPESLTEALVKSIQDSKLRKKLGKNARQWVVENRDWKVLSQKVTQLYDSLTNNSE